MKEINIVIKYDETQFNAEMRTKGFDEANGPFNSFEILGVLETLKQEQLNKLNKDE